MPASFNKCILFTCFLLTCNIVYSQQILNDTVIELSGVDIMSSRLLENTVGMKVKTIDSISLEQSRMTNLANLLEFNTPVYIKTYGIGSLATMSIRGTSSNQSSVYWNNLSISGPNDGMVDMSLIPVEFFNSIRIQYGGASSLYGTGNIGGGIHLSSQPVFYKTNRIGLDLATGSYKNFKGSANMEFGSERFYSNTALFYQQGENDFKYINTTKPGDPVENLQNASSSGFGLMQKFSTKFKKENVLNFDIWLQQVDRNIPSNMLAKPGNAEQNDKNLRAMFSWQKQKSNGHYSARAAYFNNLIHYQDTSTAIDSKIHTQSYIAEGELKTIISNRFTIFGGLQYRYDRGDAAAYNSVIGENRFNAFAALTYRFEKISWISTLTLRQGWSENWNEPFTPSIGFEGPLWRFIHGKASISRNFRAPTFNERYWVPGGNPDLRPETSWNEELTIYFDQYFSPKVPLGGFYITVFNSNVDNWILWAPTAETPGVWSPENIQKVWARGIELDGKIKLLLNNLSFIAGIQYTYTRSTNQENIDASYEKQMIYVPEHSLSGDLSIIYRQSTLSYRNHYTGERSTLKDNSNLLPPYNIGNIILSQKLNFKSNFLIIQLNINNIWNAQYQAIQYYPMPGRNYEIKISFNIINQISNQ